jgi:hypothetical protein
MNVPSSFAGRDAMLALVIPARSSSFAVLFDQLNHPACIIARRNSTQRASSRLTIRPILAPGVAMTSRMKRWSRSHGSCHWRSGGTGMARKILPLLRG